MSYELDQLYQTIILDHSRARRGETAEDVEDAGESGGVSHQFNPKCGDEITVRVTLAPGPDPTIETLEWNGEGCSISMAAASVLSEAAPGMTLGQFADLVAGFRQMLHSRGAVGGDPEVLGDAAAFAGVAKFVARVKCAMLGWVAAEDAARQAQHKLAAG